MISTGVNVLEPGVWRHLRRGAYLDMPSLLCELLGEGRRVDAYLLSPDESWVDIGGHESYLAADAALRRNPRRYLRGDSGRDALARIDARKFDEAAEAGSDDSAMRIATVE